MREKRKVSKELFKAQKFNSIAMAQANLAKEKDRRVKAENAITHLQKDQSDKARAYWKNLEDKVRDEEHFSAANTGFDKNKNLYQS